MQVNLPIEMQNLIFSFTELNTRASEWCLRSNSSEEAKSQARDILKLALTCKNFYNQLKSTLIVLNHSYGGLLRGENLERTDISTLEHRTFRTIDDGRINQMHRTGFMQENFPIIHTKVEEMDVDESSQQELWASVKNLRAPMLTCRQEYLTEFPAWQDRSGF